MNPSRIIIVAESIVSPGLTKTFPPTRAWTPNGNGRFPGGTNSTAEREIAEKESAKSTRFNWSIAIAREFGEELRRIQVRERSGSRMARNPVGLRFDFFARENLVGFFQSILGTNIIPE